MNRTTKSMIDVVSHDIVECNTVFNRSAYDFGKVLLMKYATDIHGMQLQRYLFDEPYSQYRNRDYNNSIKAFQDMLRKHKTGLEDAIHNLKEELTDSKESNKKKDNKIQSMTEEIADKDKKLSTLAGELQASAEEMDLYKEQIRMYEDVVRRTRQELDDQRREGKNLQTELAKIMEENRRLMEDNRKLRSENESLRKELSEKNNS